jgi:AraC family transcriptional regulator
MPSHPAPRPDRSAELISRSIAHVDAHLDEVLDAQTLCRQAAMSLHHFHRVFHAHTGCSVGSYVTWRRLQRACALLVSGKEPVLEIALAVGYESSQSLAKAMRRDLGTSPGAVRRGDCAPWKSLLTPKRWPPALTSSPTSNPEGEPPMQITRHAELPPGIQALTATARGMVDHQMTRAAQAAFGELMRAVAQCGLTEQVASCMCIVPDDPQGPDDPHCRYVAGVVFGYRMTSGEGAPQQPALPLDETLAWQALVAGRYAVFTHRGPYSELHRTWRGIYREWLPASGESLRDAPPMELCINNPATTPPPELLTEIWLPVQ